MEWKALKQLVYFEDGALRDVIIRDTDLSLWERWIDFVNANYEVEYTIENNPPTKSVSYHDAQQRLIGESNLTRTAKFKIGNCIAMCYFFGVDEIEYDLDPREVKSINEHSALIEHFIKVSCLLNRQVILALEGFPQEPLMLVNGHDIIIISTGGFS